MRGAASSSRRWRARSATRRCGSCSGAPRSSPGPGVLPVESDGRTLAALVFDPSLDEDPELVRAVGAAAAIALENEARVRELQDSRERIVTAGDAERRRLERNLHDGAQQRLVCIALQLRLLRNRVGDDPAAVALIAALSDELAALAGRAARARARHPPLGARPRPRRRAGVADRALPGPRPRSSASPDRRCPPRSSSPPTSSSSEALTNVAKYARRDHGLGTSSRAGGRLVIRIADDGVGGASADGGSGLRGLADRVGALGGQLRVVSPAGRGTVITAELPV